MAMKLPGKVRRTIEEHHLLSGGEAVLVALSGGPDSVALLQLLVGLSRSLDLTLTAVYLNHGIRKRAAAREEKFCSALCERLAVECLVVREDIPALALREKKGLEETARDFRYALFEKIVEERHLDKIALGHHADDQVETVLFRLARGTGRSGLLGIPHRRGRIIRPLLDLRKDEILNYLNDNGIEYCLDRSNLESKYRRNYLRNKLLPALRKNLNPSVDRAILNLVDSLEAEEAFLLGETAKAVRRSLSRSPGGKLELDLKRFSGYDKWLRRRLLRYCLKATCVAGLAPDKRTVERLDQLAAEAEGAVALVGGWRAVASGGRLVFHRSKPLRFDRVLKPGKSIRLEPLRSNLSSRLQNRRQTRLVKKTRSRQVLVDWLKVSPPLRVRSLKPGDKFRPLGMTGHKKVGDFLTDRKVPRVYRDEIPVVCDSKGIIWVVGQELADRVKIDNNTRKVLSIAYTVQRKEIFAAV